MAGRPFIAALCGLQSEARAIRAGADHAMLRIGVSGADAATAEKLATEFCDNGAAAVISVGVSGGLDATLAPGDLVIGERVLGDRAEWTCADDLLDEEALRLQARRGDVYGSDRLISTTAEKRQIFQQTGALAVDMESHSAARAAHTASIPFYAVRAIADTSDFVMPSAAANAIAPDGSTRTFATLGAALSAPGQFPALLKLGAHSSTALKTLRRDFGLIFRRLLLALDL